ncbi:MAG TPA: TIGR02450 family Trp-rich protein [Leptolyngbyaceae cyanobacterium]
MTKKQKFPYLVGSKWTATKKIDGWRHFQVVNRKNQGKWVYAEMVAACDPKVRFWLNAKLLQDGFQWQAGWQSLQEIEAVGKGVGSGGDEGDVVRLRSPTGSGGR